MDEHEWDWSLAHLRSRAATATADLLEHARPVWKSKVVVRTPLQGYVMFIRPNENSWGGYVRVDREGREDFEFRLYREDHLITADRATDATAIAVLDAFLMQLTGT